MPAADQPLLEGTVPSESEGTVPAAIEQKGAVPDPNQLPGQGPPAKKQKLTETKSIGHNIDDDTSLRELQGLDLEEPDWRASSSSNQRPTPKLISEAPELKEARQKTQTEGSEATTVAPSHRGPNSTKERSHSMGDSEM